ncbi:TonB dependent/Ligand-Gated channel TonB [Anopheles sinensis]|uniref:TonB dependent/Ligand-Gated channel TonB n=1 Tax=Anopheles sinensis TaxID=74873 RepID=A0A084WBW8_ANOSI|nr:TonB dependent/Ligand-Gated channel TonB [Anopheles sinensis]
MIMHAKDQAIKQNLNQNLLKQRYRSWTNLPAQNLHISAPVVPPTSMWPRSPNSPSTCNFPYRYRNLQRNHVLQCSTALAHYLPAKRLTESAESARPVAQSFGVERKRSGPPADVNDLHSPSTPKVRHREANFIMQ